MKTVHCLTRVRVVGILAAALLGAAAPAAAAPALRHQVDQRGDFVLLGNTLAHDCNAALPAGRVVVGTVGNCGANTGDTSADVFWRADDPAAAQARADVNITAANARSSSTLVLPAAATVTYARLYWTAVRRVADDTQVVIDREGGFTATKTADIAVSSVTSMGGGMRTYYQASADVTDLVLANGAGVYRVGGVDTIELAGINDASLIAAWSMVVFYRRDSDPPRQLTLFDGLDIVENVAGRNMVTIPLSGFLVPSQAGFDAKLGVVAFEGDSTLNGDQLFFNTPAPLSNSLNPPNNFFNGTRSLQTGGTAAAVSNAGDLPQLSGDEGSMSGVDIDVVDVTSRVNQGDTSATIRATSSADLYITGLFVTSISTFKPDFTSTSKTFRNLTRMDGTVRPGDQLEYSITTTNTGNDPGVNVRMTDQLPAGVTFVPGSISVTAGANPGAKTDQAGDDQGEYDAATRTVTVRLGTGAGAAAGGTLGPSEGTTVIFRCTIDATATGTISNQAVVTAAGMSGAPPTMYPSDGNGADPGTPPTMTTVDGCIMESDCRAPTPHCRNVGAHPWICVECGMNSQCTMEVKPICDLTSNTCRACSVDAECPAAAPACHPSGRCTQCSMSRPQCPGMARCNVGTGTCDGCLTDADCSGTTPICDGTSHMCRACRMDNECPAAAPLCLLSGTLAGTCGECTDTNRTKCVAPKPACDVANAKCVECNTNADCPMSRPVCDVAAKACRACAADAECAAPTPFCTSGICSACRTHADCNGRTPLCTAGLCVPCRTDGECAAKDPRFPACHSGDPLSGACTECSASNRTLCRSPGTKPECLVNFGFCGCSATDGDGECGDPMSGIVCNAPVGICVPGCSTQPGRNGCPVMQMCNVPAGQPIGTCVTGECTTDTDCRQPLPKCDTAVTPRQCRQCLVDGDCMSPFVCDSAATKTCVECTPTKTTNCTSNGAGTRCLANDTCGCGADNECGGPTSGRVCDLGLSKCSPGCRGTGGNGCPAGYRCTSTDSTIGQCYPAGGPIPDAAVDAAPDAARDSAPDLAADGPADAGVSDAADDGAVADLAPDRTPDLRPDVLVPDARPFPDVPPFVTPEAGPDPGLPGFLGGGGCKCDLGADGGRSGGGLALLVPAGLVAFALRRRRPGRGDPRRPADPGPRPR